MGFGDGLRDVIENFQDNRTERIQARQQGRTDRAETRAGVRETRIEEGETVLDNVGEFIGATGLQGSLGPLSFGNPSMSFGVQQGTTQSAQSGGSNTTLILLGIGVGALFLMGNMGKK